MLGPQPLLAGGTQGLHSWTASPSATGDTGWKQPCPPSTAQQALGKTCSGPGSSSHYTVTTSGGASSPQLVQPLTTDLHTGPSSPALPSGLLGATGWWVGTCTYAPGALMPRESIAGGWQPGSTPCLPRCSQQVAAPGSTGWGSCTRVRATLNSSPKLVK